LRLLSRYAGVLDEDDTLATPAVQQHVVTHVHDLIALALGTTRDATEIAERRGARAARLHAVKADIASRVRTACYPRLGSPA
jgi:hypothetical protein